MVPRQPQPLVTAADGVFSSRRERRLWIWTLAVVVAIYSTLGLARTLSAQLGDRGFGVGLFILGCLLVLAAVVTQGLEVLPGRAEIGVALGIAAVYLLVFVRMTVPAERTHLVEYGVVALFIHEALKERAARGRRVAAPALLAIAAAALVGVVDEGIQKVLPSRVFDPLDMLFNLLAAVMAVTASVALGWAQRQAGRVAARGASSRSSRGDATPRRPTSGSVPARTDRRRLLGVLLAAVVFSGCATTSAVETDLPGAAEYTFDRHEIATGSAPGQTVLTGFLLGGAMAELAVVDVGDSGERRLHIYAFDDGTWEPALDAALSPGVLFVDVVRGDGRDRLITFRRGGLSWFDPDAATERPLLDLTTSYNASPGGLHYAGFEPRTPADEGEIPHLDVTLDLNDDGRDDLAVPDLDGFWISTQSSDGSFSEPLKIGPREPFRDETAFGDRRRYGEVGISALTVPWYLSRLHRMDYDRDGRSDLAFWDEDHFEVHLQDARGRFSPLAETFTTEVPFDSDGLYSLPFGFGDASVVSLVFGLRGKTEQTVLRAVRDVDGDGVADLVTLTLEGRSVLRQRSRYAVHRGTATRDGIAFARDAATVIRPRGRAGGIELGGYSSLWIEDLDRDGRLDILRADIEIGVGAMIRALLGTSLSIGAELYRLQSDGDPDEPAARRTIKADIQTRGGRNGGFFPALLVGDVTGDGRSDLLVGKSREELYVFLGVPGPERLTREPRKVAVPLPGDERNSWLVDLDRNGKKDLLLHHRSPTGPQRVILLIAR